MKWGGSRGFGRTLLSLKRVMRKDHPPSILREIKKSISEVRRVAHLWPARLRGVRSCWVKRLINQLWCVCCVYECVPFPNYFICDLDINQTFGANHSFIH